MNNISYQNYLLMVLKAFCVSHGEDVDGLVCAAYLRHLKNDLSILVTYDDLQDTLKKIDSSVEELYICDLGIREELCKEIIRISRFASVTIVDHHATSKLVLEKLKRSGITVIYSALDCASILLYNHLEDKLCNEAARLAAYAAVSDHFEKGPLASKLLSNFDIQFIQHEALILTHALEHKSTRDFTSHIVEELSRFVFPHKINGVIEASLKQLDYMEKLIKTLPIKAKRLGRLAYVDGKDESSISTVANLLLDSLNIDLGLCYKKKDDQTVNISIRRKNGLQLHLGEITQKLAEKNKGFGGGHEKASGAKIPEKNLIRFIYDLESEIKNSQLP